MLYKSNRYKLNFSYVVWGVKEVLNKLILSEKEWDSKNTCVNMHSIVK